MPEASIVIKSTDRYSDAVKKMATVTKSFSKDVDQLEDTLYALNKNKYSLKMDLSKAKAELKEAEKQFELTHSAADGLKVELAQANYDGMVRNLKAVTTAARDTEKAISKVENQSGGSGGVKKVSELATAVAASGIGDMAKELALSAGSSLAGSLGGDAAGTMASSVLSSMATGATAGALFGPVGAAIGAAAGGIIGAATGGLQIYEKKDDAFKSYVQESYETVNSGAGGQPFLRQRDCRGAGSRPRWPLPRNWGAMRPPTPTWSGSRPWPGTPTIPMTKSPDIPNCS